MPTSAAASAGASLMPSPTIATARAARAQLRDDARPCPAGSTSACTSSMPSCAATAAALPRLSPVISTVRMPMRVQARDRCAGAAA